MVSKRTLFILCISVAISELTALLLCVIGAIFGVPIATDVLIYRGVVMLATFVIAVAVAGGMSIADCLFNNRNAWNDEKPATHPIGSHVEYTVESNASVPTTTIATTAAVV
jgi:hypothetical protein